MFKAVTKVLITMILLMFSGCTTVNYRYNGESCIKVKQDIHTIMLQCPNIVHILPVKEARP